MSHKDFVTGIVWMSEDELITCSWDSTIQRHSVSGDELKKCDSSLSNGH